MKIIFRCILAISLLLAGSSVIFAAKHHTATKIPPVVVDVTKVISVKKNQQIKVIGSMRAINGIMVRPEVSGRITQIYFNPGDNVKVGTKLFQIYPDILLAQQEEASAELELAKQDYYRQSNLYRTHAVAKTDLDHAVANLKNRVGQLHHVEAQLRQVNIVAPFSGKIGLNLINLGEYVQAGQDLASLQALDPIDVEFIIPEVYLSKVALGNAVIVLSSSYPGKIFSGKLYQIDSKVNVNNRSILVRARLPNADNKLLPGMFVETDMIIAAQTPSLIVPQTAVAYDVGDFIAYKIENNHAHKVKVTLGERDKQNVIILSGLKEGDTVVTAGQIKLYDGAEVIVNGEVKSS